MSGERTRTGGPRRAGGASRVLALILLAGLAGAQSAAAQTATPAPSPAPAKAKTPPPAPQADDSEEEPPISNVTVTAKKRAPQPGAVVGDIKPELQLSPADIQSYGVSTVTELLNELSPETRSDRGRGASTPVVLLNGRRISSFNEIQNIPTEAILRVDILPEEESLKYGYTADQRVVNIVLRRRFKAITGELAGGQATEGGDANGQAEADLLHLRGDSRLNLDLKYQTSAGLTDAERGLDANASGAPYALAGNVVSTTAGAQIDPALSALAGRAVTLAGVPAAALSRRLALADFLPTAGVANTTDTAQDRSLLPATNQLTANAVYARPIMAGINATVNATLSGNLSDAEQGLPGLSLLVPQGDPYSPFGSNVMLDRYAGQPLHQYVQGWTAHLGSTLNRDMGDWRLSLTDAYDHADTQTNTDVGINPAAMQALLNSRSASFNPFAALPAGLLTSLPQAMARSVSDSANIQFLANGPAFTIPAGQIYVSAKIGDTQTWQDSSATRGGLDQAAALARNDANAQLNLDLPLTSRIHHVLSPVGELSLNGNTAVDQVSDFGTLVTLGYGVNWTPITGVNLIVSHTNDHAAPTIQQLAGPVVETPGVRLFDYATGQTVDVTQISGGNDRLTADTRNVLKVGLTLKPLPQENLTITVNYIQSRLDNAIATFPAADAAIEAAYADRFIRNAEGELIEVDDRPVNFAREDRQEVRWGFNYSRPIGPQPPPRFDRRAFQGVAGQGAAGQGPRPPGASGAPDAAPQGGGQPGADGGGQRAAGAARDPNRPRGGGGPGGFGAPPAGGRLQLALYHTIIFQDQILARPGGPLLNLIAGAAAGGAGGQPQQEVELQAGFTLFGFGGRISADWKSATVVRGGGAGDTGDLYFSDLGTINLRLFDNFGQQRAVMNRHPWLRGARLTLNVVNLTDERIRVRDSAGATPLSYAPAYLDPAGRTVSLSLRKLFY